MVLALPNNAIAEIVAKLPFESKVAMRSVASELREFIDTSFSIPSIEKARELKMLFGVPIDAYLKTMDSRMRRFARAVQRIAVGAVPSAVLSALWEEDPACATYVHTKLDRILFLKYREGVPAMKRCLRAITRYFASKSDSRKRACKEAMRVLDDIPSSTFEWLLVCVLVC